MVKTQTMSFNHKHGKYSAMSSNHRHSENSKWKEPTKYIINNENSKFRSYIPK